MGTQKGGITYLTFTLFLVVSFLLGWVLHVSSTHLSYPHLFVTSPTVAPPFSSLSPVAQELRSPQDHIAQSQIKVYDDKVVIDGEYSWARFTNTNSMDPVFDETAHTLQQKPTSTDDLAAGDIIAFHAKGSDLPVIHRIVKTGADEQGWYAITQGDNVGRDDGQKVRFSDVSGVVVAVIY